MPAPNDNCEMKPHLSISLSAATVLLLSTPSAHSQPLPSPDPETPPSPAPPPRGDRSLALDIDQVFSTESAGDPGTSFSPVYDGGYGPAANSTYYFASTILGARVRLSRLELDAEVPFALSYIGGGGSAWSVTPGDVAFAAYYHCDWEGLRLRVGGILSLPTAPAAVVGGYPLDFGYYGSIGTAAPLTYRGFDRPWLWAKHYFTPIAPSVRIASGDEPVFQHATELVVAPLVGIDPGASVTYAVQFSEELAGHVSASVAAGASKPSASSATVPRAARSRSPPSRLSRASSVSARSARSSI